MNTFLHIVCIVDRSIVLYTIPQKANIIPTKLCVFFNEIKFVHEINGCKCVNVSFAQITNLLHRGETEQWQNSKTYRLIETTSIFFFLEQFSMRGKWEFSL